MKKQLLILFLFASILSYGQAVLIDDLNLGTDSSNPSQKVVFDNLVYFIADDGITGRELWTTDGTEAGTILFKEFVAGEDDGMPFNFNTYIYNGNLLFFANSNAGLSLWKTDGTDVGTESISDFTNGNVYFHGEINGELLFTAENKLWKTDGTVGNVTLIASHFVSDNQLIDNGTMFYGANGGNGAGFELWKTDGTPAGTEMVKNIRSGSSSSFPGLFTLINNVVYFTANDGSNGNELWTTDGTDAGTVMVTDLTSGSGSTFSTSSKTALYNNELFFAIGTEIWKTNGTETGTVLVIDVINNVEDLEVFNNKLYIFNFNSSFWESDGTTAGTMQIDVPEIEEFFHNNQTLVVGNEFYFQGRSGVEGYELWKTDGTAAGTILVKDIHPEFDDNNINNMVAYNGGIIFTANDGNWFKNELWISDGTEAGTFLLKDINEQGTNSSNPRNHFTYNNEVYFTADNGVNGRELFKTDGTNITLVKDINEGPYYSNPNSFVELNGLMYFFANTNEKGTELWMSDGTTAGTVRVTDVNPDEADGFNRGNLVVLNNKLFFFASDGVNGYELWESDGTETGTLLVKDINPGDQDSYRDGVLQVYNNALYFVAHTGDFDYELWKSDGTESGTNLFYNANLSGSGSQDNFIEFNGDLYFTSNSALGNELFRTDGTNSFLVRDIRQGNNGSFANSFVVVGGNLFFSATSTSGGELWRTDGVSTVQVKDIRPGTSGSFPQYLTEYNGDVYFVANDGTNRNELWKSDGTESGTILVKDIATGNSSSQIQNLVSFGNRLLFDASEDGNSTNKELWVSDGTETGTILFQDINPSTEQFNNGGRPQDFFVVQDVLYFSATLETTGYELYKLGAETLSVDEERQIDVLQVSAFPNPTTDVLHLNIQDHEIKKVLVYNILGNLVLEVNSESSSIDQINLQQLSSGLYLVKMMTNSNSSTKKIFKQ